jgi:hypothetical protein
MAHNSQRRLDSELDSPISAESSPKSKFNKCNHNLSIPDFKRCSFTQLTHYSTTMESPRLASFPNKDVWSSASRTESVPSQVTSIEETKTPLLITYPLPGEKVDKKPLSKFRYVIFTVYRRLFTLVVITNIIGLVFIDHRRRDNVSYIKASSNTLIQASYVLNNTKVISSAASGNLFVAVTIRQDYIINFPV